MTFTIELRPEIEASLATMAAEQGIPLAQYVHQLIEHQIPLHTQKPLSGAERAAIWLESAKNLPHTPLLSDEAISRETIYDIRG